jgi:DNA-binding cell septation regulator SpoVG
MSSLAISDVRFTLGSPADLESGLLGYVSCVLDDRLYVDGITVRKTAAGRVTLSFPEKRTARGAYPYMRQVNAAARDEIERAIMTSIGLAEDPS